MDKAAETDSKTGQLLEAIKKDNMHEAVRLIKDGADVNRKLSSPGPLVGKSLLYVAALLDNYEAAEMLLQHGAVVTLGLADTEDKKLHSQLSLAEKHPQDSHGDNSEKRKPLDEATLYVANAELCPIDPVCGNSNGHMLKLMTKYAKDLKNISLLTREEIETTHPCFNLLQYYCTWNYSNVSPERKRHFIRALVTDLGIDVNYCPYPGLTALYVACKYRNCTEVAQELLCLGAKVNDNADGKRPVDVLIDHEINESDAEDEDNTVELFKLLIKYGSNIQHRCSVNTIHNPEENEPANRDPTRPCTLIERICQINNIPIAKLKDLTMTLITAGYSLSMDNFLTIESRPIVTKLKEDRSFYGYLLQRMKQPTSLFAQCRRAVLKAVGDPCWDRIYSLQNVGVPSLIVDYLHFHDL